MGRSATKAQQLRQRAALGISGRAKIAWSRFRLRALDRLTVPNIAKRCKQQHRRRRRQQQQQQQQ
eukprot:15442364-Alexandrium_andersonii.AAC.1